jgi:hypothetical protein
LTLPEPMQFFSAAANFVADKDTPREFLERCLSHVEQFEPAVGAFVCHDISATRAAADRSAARWRDGRPLSPIDEMPLGIKDIIETVKRPSRGKKVEHVGSVVALRTTGEALDAQGGIGSPTGICACFVLGCERSLRQWAQRQG